MWIPGWRYWRSRLCRWTGSHPDVYESFRQEAVQRIGQRDPDDWPVVALALALGLPVWSQDKDFEEAGVEVYTTGDLLDALRDDERS